MTNGANRKTNSDELNGMTSSQILRYPLRAPRRTCGTPARATVIGPLTTNIDISFDPRIDVFDDETTDGHSQRPPVRAEPERIWRNAVFDFERQHDLVVRRGTRWQFNLLHLIFVAEFESPGCDFRCSQAHMHRAGWQLK